MGQRDGETHQAPDAPRVVHARSRDLATMADSAANVGSLSEHGAPTAGAHGARCRSKLARRGARAECGPSWMYASGDAHEWEFWVRG